MESSIELWLIEIALATRPSATNSAIALQVPKRKQQETTVTSLRRSKRMKYQHMDDDAARTPRPLRKTAPEIRIPPTEQQPEVQTSRKRQTPSLQSSGASTKRSRTESSSAAYSARSASPTIPAAALRTLPKPIRRVEISGAQKTWKRQPGHDLRLLLDRIRAVAEGVEVIPGHFMDELRTSASSRQTLRHDGLFDRSGSRLEFGTTPNLDEIDEICNTACEHIEWREYESSWNCMVQSRLGMAALRYSTIRQVKFVDITTATISPRTLLPITFAGESIPSQTVDFALVLKPSEVIDRAVRQLEPLPGADIQSLNHTTHGPILDRPISVSFVTTREGEGFNKAQLQLSTWATAQLNRLQILAQQSGKVGLDLPCLPLVLVQGAKWTFYAATREPNDVTIIWSSIRFGDATTRLGVFQIIAALQILIYWSETSYRPWIESVLST